MKNKLKYLLIGALVLFALNANAILIDLGQTVGQPADISKEYGRLVTQIDIYNLTHTPDLVIPLESLGIKTDTPSGEKTYTLNLTGWEGYVMLKWGGGDQFYFVKDMGEYTFTSTVQNQNGTYLGVSHWSSWGEGSNVPDSGTSLGLLGLGLGGLFSLKRKLS